MTLYTQNTIRNATIQIGTNNTSVGLDYKTRAKTLADCRRLGSFNSGVRSKEEQPNDFVNPPLQFTFRNFVFGGVPPTDVYAQLVDHKITFGKSAGTWIVQQASFTVRPCVRVYPLEYRGIKVYYILEKPDGTLVEVMDAASSPGSDRWFVKAEWNSATNTALPGISAPAFDTQVAATGPNRDFRNAFRSIRWNLAAKVEWQET